MSTVDYKKIARDFRIQMEEDTEKKLQEIGVTKTKFKAKTNSEHVQKLTRQQKKELRKKIDSLKHLNE